jgi:hypothetical protein
MACPRGIKFSYGVFNSPPFDQSIINASVSTSAQTAHRSITKSVVLLRLSLCDICTYLVLRKIDAMCNSPIMNLFWLLSFVLTSQISGSDSSKHLTATAVVSDSSGKARIQCWEFAMPFVEYPTVGMALQLANTSNLTYVVLPPRSKEGLHKPPHVM